MKNYLFIALISGLFWACVKDKPNPAPSSNINLSNGEKVYVINEGPFNSGHGSVSLYDVEKNEIVEDIYFEKNNSYLGNIVQSMSLFNSKFYIVVNNSAKVVVCNKSFEKTGEIPGLGSPRYILPVTNNKAYVSDLFANSISVVNLTSNSKTASIPCSGKTEKMALIYNKVFVTNTDREYMYVINTITDAITDSIFVGYNAGCVEIDANDGIWVLGSGKDNVSAGRLSRINAVTHQVEKILNFQLSEKPNSLCFNRTKDTLYYINKDIYRLSISDVSLPSGPVVSANGKNFYGLGVNPNNYTIYAADALDYMQKSNIYVFDKTGNTKTYFKTAICSNGFFYQ